MASLEKEDVQEDGEDSKRKREVKAALRMLLDHIDGLVSSNSVFGGDWRREKESKRGRDELEGESRGGAEGGRAIAAIAVGGAYL